MLRVLDCKPEISERCLISHSRPYPSRFRNGCVHLDEDWLPQLVRKGIEKNWLLKKFLPLCTEQSPINFAAVVIIIEQSWLQYQIRFAWSWPSSFPNQMNQPFPRQKRAGQKRNSAARWLSWRTAVQTYSSQIPQIQKCPGAPARVLMHIYKKQICSQRIRSCHIELHYIILPYANNCKTLLKHSC